MNKGFLAAATALCAFAAVPTFADTPPVTLSITDGANVHMKDALAVLQKETSATFVVDPSVIAVLSTTKVSFPDLPKMLDFLKTMEPGMTYDRVYWPTNKPVPTASQLNDIVRTMKWMANNPSVTMVTATGTLSFDKTANVPVAAPNGTIEVWYFDDEVMRAQRLKDLETASATAPTTPGTAPTMQPATGQWVNGVYYPPGTTPPQNGLTAPNRTNNNTNGRYRRGYQTPQPVQIAPGVIETP